MTTKVGIGTSRALSTERAGKEAAAAALTQIDGSADLLLVFASTGYDQRELVAAIASQAPEAALVGCSGEGVIARDMCNEDSHVVGVMALRSNTIRAEACLVPGYAEDSAETGRALVRWVEQMGNGEARLLIVMPDGLVGNCTDLLRELDEHLDIPVVGGSSGDGMILTQTYQYHGTRVVSEHVAALLLCGDVEPVIAVSHGCTPVGLPRTIDKVEDGWVREIDGQSAWEVFKEYLDGDPEDLNADGVVHLCVGEPLPSPLAADYHPHVINTPLKLDAEGGSLFFPGGRLRAGQRVQLMRRDADKIEDSAHACAERVSQTRPGQDACLMLQFDCAGRGQIMFGSMARERTVTPVQSVFPPSVPWLGFHTFGEIAPIGDQTYYHNYTVALCALFEGRT